MKSATDETRIEHGRKYLCAFIRVQSVFHPWLILLFKLRDFRRTLGLVISSWGFESYNSNIRLNVRNGILIRGGFRTKDGATSAVERLGANEMHRAVGEIHLALLEANVGAKVSLAGDVGFACRR